MFAAAAASWVCNSDGSSTAIKSPGFHRSAFVHQQFLDAPFHLRADDHLIRIYRTHQHQVFRMIDGEKIVDGGDHENNSQQNKKSVASAHRRTPVFPAALALRPWLE